MRRTIASVIEEVRHFPAIGVHATPGKLNIQEALNLYADKYRLSKNPSDYEFVVLKALYANDANDNGDAFTLEELKRFEPKYGVRVFQTFIGKPHFLEHKQDSEAYGCVIDSHLEEPKDGPAYVELCLAVDCSKDPYYGILVRSGRLRKYSMGCTVEWTKCRVCGNEAHTEDQFCEHIAQGKMQEFEIEAADGTKTKVLAAEECYGVCYDEISDVGDPAEKRAVGEEFLKAASGKGVGTHKKFANKKQAVDPSLAPIYTKPPRPLREEHELGSFDYPQKLDRFPGNANPKREPREDERDTHQAAGECKKCGTPLSGLYCTDMTCPYSDWPQKIELKDLQELSRAEIEDKYKTKKKASDKKVAFGVGDNIKKAGGKKADESYTQTTTTANPNDPNNKPEQEWLENYAQESREQNIPQDDTSATQW